MHVKTVKVTNSKNVLVQIPGFIIEKWGIGKGDAIEVIQNVLTGELILRPRKSYISFKLKEE